MNGTITSQKKVLHTNQIQPHLKLPKDGPQQQMMARRDTETSGGLAMATKQTIFNKNKSQGKDRLLKHLVMISFSLLIPLLMLSPVSCQHDIRESQVNPFATLVSDWRKVRPVPEIWIPGQPLPSYWDLSTGKKLPELPFILPYGFTGDYNPVQSLKEKRYGLMDAHGRFIIPIKYKSICSFIPDKGRAVVETDNGMGIIDLDGNWIVPPDRYDDIGGYNEGLCYYITGGKLGFIDPDGKVVIQAIFPVDNIYGAFGANFQDGVCVICDTAKGFVVIDKKGRVIFQKGPEYIVRQGMMGLPPEFRDGRLMFAVRAGANERGDGIWRYGFFAKDGSIAIEPKYGCVNEFYDGLALFNEEYMFTPGEFEPVDIPEYNRLWGYMDTSGNIAVKPQYMWAKDFSDGMAAVATSQYHWGYIDTKGNMVIPAEYWEAGDFERGYAKVLLPIDDHTGIYVFIDKQGNIVCRTDVKGQKHPIF